MEAEDWTKAYRQDRSLRIEPQDDGSFLFVRTSDRAPLDLDKVPDGTRLEIATTRTGTRRRIDLINARSGHHVLVVENTPVAVESGTLGTISFERGRASRADDCIFTGTADRLYATKGQVKLADATITEAVITGGEITGDVSQVDKFVASGNVNLPSAGVEMLEVASGGAAINVRGGGSRLQRLALPEGSVPGGILRIRGERVRSGQSVGGTLRVDTLIGTNHIKLEEANLSVARVKGRVTVSGQGALHVPTGQTVTDVTLLQDVRLNAGQDAALLRFGGRLLVGNCKHATVLSSPGDTYEYGGLTPSTTGRSPAPDQLTGATLRGILIHDDASGRRRLSELSEVAVVEPSLDNLRVRKTSWRIPFARRRLVASIETERELDDAAFFAQELAGLVNNKCGSGSIRTRANWAAYRGRHLNSASVWERLALVPFRLVGYGQRPGPPFLLWPLIAFVSSFLPLSLDGGWGERYINLLVSPLFLLRLAGDPQLPNGADLADLGLILIRTLIALPFVFLVVAIARFLRAEWPWAASPST